MPARASWINHTFGGGWATDFGPNYYGAPDQSGTLRVPFLVNARNVVFEFDGGPHKAPGTVKFNTSAYGGATGSVVGLYDYWRQGTAGSATQRVMVASDNGTNLLIGQAAISAVSFTDVFTTLTTGAVPNFSTFNDLLIIADDNTADVPRSWDQTTAQNLAGSPPRFSFSVTHKDRLWAAGNFAVPSRLYYSVLSAPDNWTGAGSGSIDIDLDDGDMITGLISFKGDLWVFKGPNRGSIHRITGSAPTGSDAFARVPFIQGLGAIWISSIFNYEDDIGFISPMGVHSLAATAAYGNFSQAYLSYPINGWLRDTLRVSRGRYWQAVNDPVAGRVYITFTASGYTTNNRVLVMDYRFKAQGETYPRWSLWDGFSWGAMAMIKNSSLFPTLYAGGYTGTVWQGGNSTRSNDGTSISMQVTLPYLAYGNEWRTKSVEAAGVTIAPKNTNNITFGWQRDAVAQQTQTVAQGGSVVLDSFLLGTDVLGGSRYNARFMDMETGGEFRLIQYEVTDNINNSDLEVHGILARVIPGAESTELTI